MQKLQRNLIWFSFLTTFSISWKVVLGCVWKRARLPQQKGSFPRFEREKIRAVMLGTCEVTLIVLCLIV